MKFKFVFYYASIVVENLSYSKNAGVHSALLCELRHVRQCSLMLCGVTILAAQSGNAVCSEPGLQ